jgi:eukaryotic-like serine/threonine-protein kinase
MVGTLDGRGECTLCAMSVKFVTVHGACLIEVVLSVSRSISRVIRFGVFELSLDTGELRKAGALIKLAPQPFRVLTLIAGHAGELVTREEIRQQVWGAETFVDFETGLNHCINQIRTALGDNADTPRYIQTIPRRGYRFISPVEEASAPHSGLNGQSPTPSGGVSRPELDADTASVAARSETAAVARDRVPPAGVVAGQRRTRRFAISVGIFVILALGVIALIHLLRPERATLLTDKDTVVLGEFSNSTGDPVFDGTLRQALAIQLEQSPFLNVLSDGKVRATLREMSRPVNDRLTEDVTREICLRTNSRAYLAGSIAQIGDHYLIGLRALNCETDQTLASTEVEAQNRNAVLKALDHAAVSLRGQLGESLSSVQKYATPVEEATTPSLEALKAYSLGQKMRFAKGETAGLPFYARAVELDPSFAMAYRAMSMAYGNLGELAQSTENARRAYELREKVSERERFSIEANYYDTATGELEKAAQTYELWQQTYPRDYVPYGNLGGIYDKLGNLEKALGEDREALRLQPNQETVYANLGGDYMNLNRLDEAEAVYKQAEERKLEGETLLANRYELAFLKGDAAQMTQLVSTAMGKPGTEDVLLASQADTEAWYGRLSNARELTRRAMDSARHNDAKDTAADYQAAAALREVASGNREQARAEAGAAVKLAPNRFVQEMAALALAQTGDTVEAEKLVAGLDQRFPLGTLVQRYWLPTIHAAVALQRKDPNRAIELLKAMSTTDLGSGGQLLPVYLRGEAYLMLHDGNAAATEFQKFIDHRGLVANFPWGALARLGLARAYAEQGNTVKARVAYQDFLTLWKNADADVPILNKAQSEFAKLQ